MECQPCKLLVCPVDDDYELQALTVEPLSPECQPCRLLACVVDDFYSLYLMQDLFNPVIPAVIFNQAVFFVHVCPEGETVVYSGTLPSWITLDAENSRLIGSAGIYQAGTQAEANGLAQNALDEFGEAAVLSGDLECFGCVPPADICADGLGCLADQIYRIQGYFDGMVANPNDSPTGNPRWDGTFSFFVNDPPDFIGWGAGEKETLTMDGDDGFCFNFLTYNCADGLVWSLNIGDDTGTIWRGEKTTGNTPEGVYARVSGFELAPATLTIELIPGTPTPIVNSITCVS